MAKITIELDTTNDEDAALAAKLFAGAPPRAESEKYSGKGGGQKYPYATSFPPIQPSTEPAEGTPNLPHVTPPAEAYEIGVSTLASVGAGEAAAQGARETLAVPTPPASPAPAGQAQELDAAGLPWDARIHSESRARTADGTWRRKRGVDQVVVDLVTSELRAAYPAPTGQPAPAPNPFPVQPPERTDVPPPPAAPVTAPPPPAARGVPDLAAAVARGTLSLADLNAACLQHGCANVLELNKNPAALTAVCAQFDAIGAFG